MELKHSYRSLDTEILFDSFDSDGFPDSLGSDLVLDSSDSDGFPDFLGSDLVLDSSNSDGFPDSLGSDLVLDSSSLESGNRNWKTLTKAKATPGKHVNKREKIAQVSVCPLTSSGSKHSVLFSLL